MIFPSFRGFRPRDNSIAELAKYLSIDLIHNFNMLTLGLTKLRMGDNFAGWVVDGLEIKAGSEVILANNLGEPVSHRIILRGGDGAQNIVDGDGLWTAQQVTLKNVGAVDATISVAFLK